MHRMQVLAAALVAGAAIGARPVVAQTGFNGVITFTDYERHGGKPSTFVQTTKGHKLRLDGFGGDSGSMIIDNDAKVMMIVEPRKKQVIVMTQDEMKQMQAMMGPMMERMKQQRAKSKRPSSAIKFAPTGKTEKVAGVKCEVWHGSYAGADTSETEEGEACVARGVGFALAELTFANPMLQASSYNDQWDQYRDLIGADKGLLKATKIEKGQEKTQLEATSIEPKIVSDDAFRPPADYKEVHMGEMMMKGMQGRNKPPATSPAP